jgi:amino acid permease
MENKYFETWRKEISDSIREDIENKTVFSYDEAENIKDISKMLQNTQKKQKCAEFKEKFIILLIILVCLVVFAVYCFYESKTFFIETKELIADFIENPLEITAILAVSVAIVFIIYKAKDGTEKKHKKIMEEKLNGKNSDDNSAR